MKLAVRRRSGAHHGPARPRAWMAATVKES